MKAKDSKCKICDTETKKLFKTKILNKYFIQYYQCPNCLFIQTEKEFWLKEAYNSPINLSDTGVLTRNIGLGLKTALVLTFLLRKDGRFLDYAGGYGTLTRLMRDIGFDFYWHDPYTKNELARGFEGDPKKRYAALTIFEGFEHFQNPIREIENIFKISDIIILSTTLVPKPAPKAKDWWYYGIEHGQHIALYSKETFEKIAKRYNCFFYTNGKYFHVLSKKRLSQLAFKLLISPLGLLLIPIVFLKKKSKTISDNQLMAKKQN